MRLYKYGTKEFWQDGEGFGIILKKIVFNSRDVISFCVINKIIFINITNKKLIVF